MLSKLVRVYAPRMLHRLPLIGRLFDRKKTAANFAPGVHSPMASDVAELEQTLGHERADAIIREHRRARKSLRKR